MKAIVITAVALATMLGVTCYGAPKKGRAAAAKAAEVASSNETKPRRQVLQGEEYVEKFSEKVLASIREAYSKGQKTPLNAFTGSRRSLKEEDKLAGDALMSEFGTKYLPNAYASYEKKRDVAFEFQQVFNEEFPKPWTIKEGDPKWEAFNKVLEKFVRVRTEYFWSRDELIHYWYMLKLGVLDASDFAKLDGAELAPRLLPQLADGEEEFVLVVAFSEDERAFAAKYAPDSGALYQSLEQARKEAVTLMLECRKSGIQMDDVRYSRALVAQQDKVDDITRAMNEVARNLKAWRTEHRTTLKSSEEVAECDQELAKRIKPFVESLPNYVKTRVLGPIIPESDMIEIPNMKYRMQRTELTQLQWMLVMGYNPVQGKDEAGARKPVTGVKEGGEIIEFIRSLNEIDNKTYRVPMLEMWRYACYAGKESLNVEVNRVAWGSEKFGAVHNVALKEPNEWGFYDMLGNAPECTVCLFYGKEKSAQTLRNVAAGAVGGGEVKCDETGRILLRDRDDLFRLTECYPDRACGRWGYRLCVDEGSSLWKTSADLIRSIKDTRELRGYNGYWAFSQLQELLDL